MSGDVDQRPHVGIVPGFADDRAAIAVTDEYTGPSWRSRIRLVAATSSANDVNGSWTRVTLYPSATSISYTGRQPPPVDEGAVHQNDVFDRRGDCRHSDSHQEKGAGYRSKAKDV